MDKSKQIKGFFIKLAENFIIQLIIGLIFLLGAIYFSKDIISSFFSYIQRTNLPLWMTFVIVLAIILIFIFIKILLKKDRGPFIMSFRTRNGDEEEIPFSFNNINWIAFIPKQLFGPDEYVWLTGPFCPICAYELKWKGKISKVWHCERCNKNFNTFRKTAHDEKSYVENMAYADIFRKIKFRK